MTYQSPYLAVATALEIKDREKRRKSNRRRPPWLAQKAGVPRLTYHAESKTFVWVGRFEDKEIPKTAGFRWSPEKKVWWTQDFDTAARLIAYADQAADDMLRPNAFVPSPESIAASRATDADVDVPRPDGLDYMGFQRAGIAYALQRTSTLIADDMGLGKTIQAIGVWNYDASIKRTLVVCPASLKTNWRREFERWAARPCWVTIATARMFPMSADVAVINYEQLPKYRSQIMSRTWDLVILDEAHLTKNPKAIRTVLAHSIPARRRLFLTGTPIVNRPAELWPIVSTLWPEVFKPDEERAYKNRYCYSWTGSKLAQRALLELQEKLRSVGMIRRLKKDVLTELPAKMRSVVELPPPNGAQGALSEEAAAAEAFAAELFEARLRVELLKASEDEDEYRDAVADLRAMTQADFGELTRLRHQTALAKVPAVVEHVKAVLEAGSKLVLFAHHHDVIDSYMGAFAKVAVKLTGEMDTTARQRSIDLFQRDPNVLLFVGSIQAAGVGITLTAASHVCFAEMDWVPGNMTQAEDRCHRIGQTDSVQVEHLVLEGSLDSSIAHTLVTKQRVIEQALDLEKDELAGLPLVPDAVESATHGLSRAALAQQAARLTPEDIEAVMAGLREMEASGATLHPIDAAIVRTLANYSANIPPKQAVLGRRIVRRYAASDSQLD